MAKSKLPNHIYHLAEAANWLSIQRYGLLSASKLLDLAEITGGSISIPHKQRSPIHSHKERSHL
jgi:hypothetical protein